MSNDGGGGASMRRARSPSSLAQCRASTSRDEVSVDALAVGRAFRGRRPRPAQASRESQTATVRSASRASCASCDSSPMHAPAQRLNWRWKQGPAVRRSSCSRIQHKPCSAASVRRSLARASLGREGTIASGQRVRRDVERTHEARQPSIEHQHAGFLLAAQRAIVRRQLGLDEHRLAQQRAELARGLLELDAANLLRQPKVGLAAPIAAEVRGDALAEIDALADVDRQRVVAEEAIYARRFGNARRGNRAEAAAAGSEFAGCA